MNRALFVIVVPVLLVAGGYVVVLRAMGVSSGYLPLIAAAGVFCGLHWVSRRPGKKAGDPGEGKQVS